MKRQYDNLYKSLYGFGAASVCVLLLLSAFRVLPVDAQSTSLFSSDPSREQGLDTRIQTFFETLKRGNSLSAFDELLQQSPLGSASAGAPISELQKQVDELGKDFGDILNWDKLESKRMGEDVIVVQYILKYEKFPVVWSFAFYRKPASTSVLPMTPNTWVLVELQFDTNIL